MEAKQQEAPQVGALTHPLKAAQLNANTWVIAECLRRRDGGLVDLYMHPDGKLYRKRAGCLKFKTEGDARAALTATQGE